MKRKTRQQKWDAPFDVASTVNGLLNTGNPEEFFLTIDSLVKCQGPVDYHSMPTLGKLVTALYELDATIGVEGVGHYIFYSEGRWKDAVAFLRIVGAKEKAALLDKLIGIFPSRNVPVDQGQRMKELSRIEHDSKRSCVLDEVTRMWNSNGDDIPLLVRQYLTVDLILLCQIKFHSCAVVI